MSHKQRDDEQYRVMVVDDEPIVHRMMQRIIDASHLPIALAGVACSVSEAVDVACGIRPHICLLDIQIDDSTGLELVDQLNEILDYRPIVIYVTAHPKFEYAQQAVRLGATDYLVKPIRRADVLEALSRAVNRIQANKLELLEKEELKRQLQEVLPASVAASGPAGETRKASVVRAARKYIDEHYAEPITVMTVSDDLNLSPGYLGSLFKAEYGISFKAYIRRVRIARAKELMRDPRLNLTEIAQRVGFEDISYFSQCFLEEAGVRPSEYRGGGRNWPK